MKYLLVLTGIKINTSGCELIDLRLTHTIKNSAVLKFQSTTTTSEQINPKHDVPAISAGDKVLFCKKSYAKMQIQMITRPSIQ